MLLLIGKMSSLQIIYTAELMLLYCGDSAESQMKYLCVVLKAQGQCKLMLGFIKSNLKGGFFCCTLFNVVPPIPLCRRMRGIKPGLLQLVAFAVRHSNRSARSPPIYVQLRSPLGFFFCLLACIYKNCDWILSC
jgi:hypothetical protein